MPEFQEQVSDWFQWVAQEVIERSQTRIGFWQQKPAEDATAQAAIEREQAFIARVQADAAKELLK